ncbi:MAG TPA: hypothetical protein VFD39_06400, partial [Trueperaceae bacterium]|nr:hypothetical protein [Trueperaceae bacterium]
MVAKAARQAAREGVDPANLTGAVEAELPAAPRLQLASAVDRPPRGDDWLHEIKFDGYRMAATLDAGEVHLTTRNLLEWTDRFTAIAAAAARLPARSAVLDGEIVALGADGRSDFGALQRWLGVTPDGGAERGESKRTVVVYQLFDLLFLDGYDLRGVALEQRKTALADLLGSAEGFAKGAAKSSPKGSANFSPRPS